MTDMGDKKLSLLDCVGNTPLVQMGNVYAKAEGANPGGSIKDRIALEIVLAAEREGQLQPGGAIVEATSGNTGIALAMVAAARGYRMTVVMPENMSVERQQVMKALGAEVVLTPESGGLNEAVARAGEIARSPGVFLTRQFSNPNNIKAQEKTGEEILREIGAVDAVVAGVGTGGTLMGISNVMKRANKAVKVFAVEPAESAVISGGSAGPHGIQGIGAGFIPELLDVSRLDGVIKVSSAEAVNTARDLARKYGLMVGISSGANIAAALSIAVDYGRIVTVLPDRAERYLSMNPVSYTHLTLPTN